MIISTILAGTIFSTLNTATPLQPYNVQTVDNVTTRVYVAHDTTLHVSHTQGFEMVIDNGKKVVAQGNGVKSYDIKVKAGTTYNVTALSGVHGGTYKVGGVTVKQTPLNW